MDDGRWTMDERRRNRQDAKDAKNHAKVKIV
jgi:hypothetical protein